MTAAFESVDDSGLEWKISHDVEGVDADVSGVELDFLRITLKKLFLREESINGCGVDGFVTDHE